MKIIRIYLSAIALLLFACEKQQIQKIDHPLSGQTETYSFDASSDLSFTVHPLDHILSARSVGISPEGSICLIADAADSNYVWLGNTQLETWQKLPKTRNLRFDHADGFDDGSLLLMSEDGVAANAQRMCRGPFQFWTSLDQGQSWEESVLQGSDLLYYEVFRSGIGFIKAREQYQDTKQFCGGTANEVLHQLPQIGQDWGEPAGCDQMFDIVEDLICGYNVLTANHAYPTAFADGTVLINHKKLGDIRKLIHWNPQTQVATEIHGLEQHLPHLEIQYWKGSKGIVRDTSGTAVLLTLDQGQTWQATVNLTLPAAKWHSVPGTDKLISITNNQFCEDLEGDFDFRCYDLPIALDPIEVEVVGDDDYWVLTKDALIQISK